MESFPAKRENLGEHMLQCEDVEKRRNHLLHICGEFHSDFSDNEFCAIIGGTFEKREEIIIIWGKYVICEKFSAK